MLPIQPSAFKLIKIKLLAVEVPILPFRIKQLPINQKIKIQRPLPTKLTADVNQ
jgi:hypothetical protein